MITVVELVLVVEAFIQEAQGMRVGLWLLSSLDSSLRGGIEADIEPESNAV